MRPWMTAIILLGCCVLMVPGSAVAGQAPGFRLVVENGRISLEARQVPLLKVLAEMARYTDAEIFIAQSIASEPVDISLTRLPVDKALQRLLRPYDFVASFRNTASGEDRMRMVKVYPRGNRTGNLARVHARRQMPRAVSSPPAVSRAVGDTRPPLPRSLPGAVLSGRYSAAAAGTIRQQDGGRSVPVSGQVGLAMDLASQRLQHEQWRIARSRSSSGAMASEHIPMLVATGMEQQLTEVRRDDLLTGLERLQFLEQGGPQAFVITLTR